MMEPELKRQDGKKVDIDTPSKFLNPNVRYIPKFETEFETKFETKLETKFETKLETKFETKLETKFETKLETKFETKFETKLETKVCSSTFDTFPSMFLIIRYIPKFETKTKFETKFETKFKTKFKTQQFTCSICNATLREKIDLQAHLATHNGEKNFACDMCEKRYRHRSSNYDPCTRRRFEPLMRAKMEVTIEQRRQERESAVASSQRQNDEVDGDYEVLTLAISF
ncbi:hypothetical protein DPMN_079142 [Dreissena polymorpha]|uniref:C2H2-type domain-containing protein n=1 Tax=Dreissena polymorpha TaxID=45954 RepID=A0A9D4BSR5_DREPO|nr:hypothetical protein DPMN_079142 [Dreissena polymorpha]